MKKAYTIVYHKNIRMKYKLSSISSWMCQQTAFVIITAQFHIHDKWYFMLREDTLNVFENKISREMRSGECFIMRNLIVFTIYLLYSGL